MANDVEIVKAFEFDGSTGQHIERELTAEELADRAAVQADFDARQAEQQAKATARASALAKLADLGLTAEEIAAL